MEKFNFIYFLIELGAPKQYVGDISILVFYLIASIIVIILVKQKNLGAFLMSSYVAYAIFSFSYFMPKNPTFGIAYFAVLTVLTFILMKKIVVFRIGGAPTSVMIKSVFISLLTTGMTASLILNWLPPENLYGIFTPFTKKLFTTEIFKFSWMAIPFLFLALVKKRKY